MSRDWTPRELYAVDEYLNNRLRNGAITWNIGGEDVRLDNHIAKDRYPELSFLLNGFASLYKSIADNENAKSFLDAVEGVLVKLEAGMGKGDNASEEIPEGFEAVREWFQGEPSFYYSERNNEMFTAWLNEQMGITEPDIDGDER